MVSIILPMYSEVENIRQITPGAKYVVSRKSVSAS